MNFKIADGSTKDIVVGSTIKIRPDFCPTLFIGASVPITKIAEGYPFATFYKEESYEDEDGNMQTRIIFNEESAVSPNIITEVT